MSPEIYEALRKRISIISKEDANTMMGLERYDKNYIDGIIHQMSTNNIWNVCQRFYSLLENHKNIDKRLLAL